MNQNIESTSQNSSISPSIINPIIEEQILQLEEKISKLNQICLEIDPYRPLTDALKLELLKLNIIDLSDPFKITNTLIMLLENAIDELHKIKPPLNSGDDV